MAYPGGVHSVRLHPGGSRGAPKRRGEKKEARKGREKKGKKRGAKEGREGKGKKICKRKGKGGRNQKKIGYKKKNTRVATVSDNRKRLKQKEPMKRKRDKKGRQDI